MVLKGSSTWACGRRAPHSGSEVPAGLRFRGWFGLNDPFGVG